MLHDVRSRHTEGICRHMNACHAPCTHYNMCTSFYTGTSTCGCNLTEVCATIGDWVFIFSHNLNTVVLLETVLLLETWVTIRENTLILIRKFKNFRCVVSS